MESTFLSSWEWFHFEKGGLEPLFRGENNEGRKTLQLGSKPPRLKRKEREAETAFSILEGETVGAGERSTIVKNRCSRAFSIQKRGGIGGRSGGGKGVHVRKKGSSLRLVSRLL